MILGIDTSKHQSSKVDYAAAKKNGVEFVFLRVGCGKTKDICFEKDYASAVAAGLQVGVYHYSYAKTEAEAVQDATRVLGWLNGRKLDLPVVFDLEDPSQKGTSRKVVNANMYLAFAERIKKEYPETMLYTGEYFYNNYIMGSMIQDDLWIAKYDSKKPSVNGNMKYWQFSSAAIKEPYYNGKLDRNYLLVESTGTKTVEGNPYPIPTRTIKKKVPLMSGNDVKWIQWELKNRGYSIDIDGKYGTASKSCVALFQQKRGLLADGIVGPATRHAMTLD